MSKVDVLFIKPFVDSVVKTLQVQCNVEAKVGKIFLKGQGPKAITDIAGVIALASNAFTGTIAICFPEKTFLGVMEAMLGEKFATITPEVQDGAGEIINIVFGQAKIVLNEKGYEIRKAIPTVIRGANIAITHLSPTPTVMIPYVTPCGDFTIEIAIENQET